MTRDRRTWSIVASLLTIFVLVSVTLPRAKTLFWAETQVVFLMPGNSTLAGNPLQGEYQDLVLFAAIIEREFNGGSRAHRTAGTQATIYGMGITHGYSVTLPNVGGQWQNSFSSPHLDVEVVSESAEETARMLQEVASNVAALATKVQAESGVRNGNMIRATLRPTQPEVSVLRGDQRRGLLASFTLACLVFGLLLRRSGRSFVGQETI